MNNFTKIAFVLYLTLFSICVNAQTIILDVDEIAEDIKTAFTQSSSSKKISAIDVLPIVQLPFNEEGQKQFFISEKTVMSSDLQSQFPNIKTYSVTMVKDPTITGSITVSPNGFFANYFANGSMIGIYPTDLKNPNEYYIETGNGEFEGCEVMDEDIGNGLELNKPSGFDSTSPLKSNTGSFTNDNGEVVKRRYDIAIATTGEFTTANGGTEASAMTTIVNSLSAVNDIYNREMAVEFVLVGQPCIFTDLNNDPFIPDASDAPSDTRAVQANAAIQDCSNGVSYDIGHVFHNVNTTTNGGSGDWKTGGLAGIGVICSANSSAQGWSSSFDNNSNRFIIIVAHELGHMLGATHTANAGGETCSNIVSSVSAYEIGSGFSIMSYDQLCGPLYNYEQEIGEEGVIDGNYFHAISIEQMTNNINAENCHENAVTNNTPPTINMAVCSNNTINIPIGTPFRLSAEVIDQENDPLTYCWEQFDEDGPGRPTQGATLSQPGSGGMTAGNDPLAPLFRSYRPSSVPYRYFPDLIDYADNVNSIGTEFEVLSQVPRNMTFALTVRDNNLNGGGVTCEAREINVIDAGPLVVNSPCTNGSLNIGEQVTLTWDTNGSNDACANVKIKMSIDGGHSFPYDLNTTTYASGNAIITIPTGTPFTNKARFQVICTDTPCAAFFAITESDCTINSTCNTQQTLISAENPMIFPEESPSLNLSLTNNLGSSVDDFSGILDSISPVIDLVFNNCDMICNVTSNNTYYNIHNFTPDLTGEYTFEAEGYYLNTLENGLVLNLYELPFTPGLCNNQIIGSIVQEQCNSAVMVHPSIITATLTSGVSYGLVVSTFSLELPNIPINYNVNWTTLANANIYDGLVNPPNYGYTYLATNQSNGIITNIDADSDFSTLLGGCYDIYGIHYNETAINSVGLSNFIGQSIDDILLNNCVLFSSNAQELCVTCNMEPGSSCNDGDDCTINDLVQADCSCVGTFVDADSDGTCDPFDICNGAEPGTPCDDDDATTLNDVIQPDCSCLGDEEDCLGVLNGTTLPGTTCDDGDDCTENDVIQDNCSCAGIQIETSGCTDATACNYDATACIDDGSCNLGNIACSDPCNPITGCLNINACNYNATACVDDGSCDVGNSACSDPCNPVTGCTDATACNYNPAACIPDGSCDLGNSMCSDPCNVIEGCTHINACNYDDTACVDNGSCDFGSCLFGSVASRFFVDTNEDGNLDDADEKVEGVIVVIDGADYDNLVTTAPDGYFSFEDIPVGTYQMDFYLPEGYRFDIGMTQLGITKEVNAGMNTLVDDIPGSSEDGVAVQAIPPCDNFAVISNVVCNELEGTYEVLVTYAGGNPTATGYTILDNGTGTTINTSLTNTTFGPYTAGTGYSYTVSVANNPDCTETTAVSVVSCTVTAIELLRFDGQIQGENNLLSWTTASEIDADYFTLEKSLDGVNFTEVTKVAATGNSNVNQDYNYLDTEATTGVTYYRLLETNREGTTMIASDVITLSRNANFEIVNVIPVPTTDFVNLSFQTATDKGIIITIYDITGRTLETQTTDATIGLNTITLNVSNYATGAYFVQITDGNTEAITRIVKH